MSIDVNGNISLDYVFQGTRSLKVNGKKVFCYPPLHSIADRSHFSIGFAFLCVDLPSDDRPLLRIFIPNVGGSLLEIGQCHETELYAQVYDSSLNLIRIESSGANIGTESWYWVNFVVAGNSLKLHCEDELVAEGSFNGFYVNQSIWNPAHHFFLGKASGPIRTAQSFLVQGQAILRGAKFKLCKVGSGHLDALQCSLYSAWPDGRPKGLLASSLNLISADELSQFPLFKDVFFEFNNYSLEDGRYALVLSRNEDLSDENFYAQTGIYENRYLNGSWMYQSSQGAWNISNYDAFFEIWADGNIANIGNSTALLLLGQDDATLYLDELIIRANSEVILKPDVPFESPVTRRGLLITPQISEFQRSGASGQCRCSNANEDAIIIAYSRDVFKENSPLKMIGYRLGNGIINLDFSGIKLDLSGVLGQDALYWYSVPIFLQAFKDNLISEMSEFANQEVFGPSQIEFSGYKRNGTTATVQVSGMQEGDRVLVCYIENNEIQVKEVVESDSVVELTGLDVLQKYVFLPIAFLANAQVCLLPSFGDQVSSAVRLALEDVIRWSGASRDDFGIESDDKFYSSLEILLNELFLYAKKYTRQNWEEFSSAPIPIQHTIKRALANWLTSIYQQRKSPIIKMDEYRLELTSPNIWTDELKETLQAYCLHSAGFVAEVLEKTNA